MAAVKTAAVARARRKRIIRVIQALISVVVAAAMFGLVIPKIANYSGIWNSFLKLGLPVIALACVAITGHASSAAVAPAIVGVAILAGVVLLFALMLLRKRFAKTIGDALGKTWSRLKKMIRRSSVTDWGDRAVQFRHETIELLGKRWIPLTLTTIVSQLALYFVLVLALRHVGVSE